MGVATAVGEGAYLCHVAERDRRSTDERRAARETEETKKRARLLAAT